MSTSLLSFAIAQRQWELAALCLMMGVVRAAESLPPDAVDALLELLAEAEFRERPKGRRRDRRR